MIIDFSAVLNKPDGKPLKWPPQYEPIIAVGGEPIGDTQKAAAGQIIGEREVEPAKDLTLAKIAIEALYGTYEGEKLEGEKKNERFLLSLRLVGKVDLKAEEISLLKRLIGKNSPTLVVGRAYQLLDPKGAESDITINI